MKSFIKFIWRFRWIFITVLWFLINYPCILWHKIRYSFNNGISNSTFITNQFTFVFVIPKRKIKTSYTLIDFHDSTRELKKGLNQANNIYILNMVKCSPCSVAHLKGFLETGHTNTFRMLSSNELWTLHVENLAMTEQFKIFWPTEKIHIGPRI